MKDAPDVNATCHVVLHNDDATPYAFVVKLLVSVLSKSETEAKQLASAIDSCGAAVCGTYPRAVAEAIVATCQEEAKRADFPLKVSSQPSISVPLSDGMVCSFCDKPGKAVRHLYAGRHGNICDECALKVAPALQGALSTQTFSLAHEMLDWHFAGVSTDQIVTTGRKFPARVRADVQNALDGPFSDDAIKLVGIHSEHWHDTLDCATLLRGGQNVQA